MEPEFIPGMDLTIVPRKEWSGTDIEVYKWKEKLVRPAPIVYFGSTKTQPCVDPIFCAGSLRLMQFTHFSKYPTDIRFNFMIGGDGRVYEGRGWFVPPRLTETSFNDALQSILIGYVGMYKEEDLPAVMREAANNLINYGQQFLFIDTNVTYKSITHFVEQSE